MEAALWGCLSLLCLQGSFLQLTHGANCPGTSQGEDCVSGQTTGGKNDGLVRLMPSTAIKTHTKKQPQRGRPGAHSALGVSRPSKEEDQGAALRMLIGNDMPSDVPLDRQKRQSGWNSILPGSFSAKGFPNTLIEVQTERTRRHLGQSGTKKKNKHKSRVGSFSLLSNNNPSTSLQVTRVRRQVQNERKKVKPRGRPGAFSVLARPSKSASLGQRRKRSAQKKKQTKIIVCS